MNTLFLQHFMKIYEKKLFDFISTKFMMTFESTFFFFEMF